VKRLLQFMLLKTRTYYRYLIFLLFVDDAFAAGETLGGMASLITQSFTNVTKLITAGAYLAGMGFAISAVLKFKEHKDNPTQVQIGKPIGLTFVSAALIFLPSLLGITGATLFTTGGTVGGPEGVVFTGS